MKTLMMHVHLVSGIVRELGPTEPTPDGKLKDFMDTIADILKGDNGYVSGGTGHNASAVIPVRRIDYIEFVLEDA